MLLPPFLTGVVRFPPAPCCVPSKKKTARCFTSLKGTHEHGLDVLDCLPSNVSKCVCPCKGRWSWYTRDCFYLGGWILLIVQHDREKRKKKTAGAPEPLKADMSQMDLYLHLKFKSKIFVTHWLRVYMCVCVVGKRASQPQVCILSRGFLSTYIFTQRNSLVHNKVKNK